MPWTVKIIEDAHVVEGRLSLEESPIGEYVKSFGCTRGLVTTPDRSKARTWPTWEAAHDWIRTRTCPWGHDWDYSADVPVGTYAGKNLPLTRFSRDIEEI